MSNKNIELYFKNKLVLDSKDLSTLKKEIKKNIDTQGNDKKVFVVSYSNRKTSDYVFRVMITQQTINKNSSMITKDDDKAITIKFNSDEYQNIGFNNKILNQLINKFKTGKYGLIVNASEILGKTKTKEPVDELKTSKIDDDILEKEISSLLSKFKKISNEMKNPKISNEEHKKLHLEANDILGKLNEN